LAHPQRLSSIPDLPLLDRDYIERLQNHLGEQILRDLMFDSMLELAAKLDGLEEVFGIDEAAAGRLVHDIAGSAGYMGLTALAESAAEANRDGIGVANGYGVLFRQRLTALRKPSFDALSEFLDESKSIRQNQSD